MHILLVENNSVMNSHLKSLLESYGCEVVLAKNGEEAIGKFNNRIHGVLMDISLPDIDGFQAANIIRKNFPESKAYIYGISFLDSNSEDLHSKKCIDGFLKNPLETEELQSFLVKVLYQ